MIHKIMKIISQTRLDGAWEDCNKDPLIILKNSEDDQTLYKYKKDVYFCCYKTTFKDLPAILIIFNMKLPGAISGSSSSSETVMEIVKMMENILMPISDISFVRDIDGNKTNMGILKIIKIIDENENM